jgi:hypothetical protein
LADCTSVLAGERKKHSGLAGTPDWPKRKQKDLAEVGWAANQHILVVAI